jgi:TatD DNase family protein
VVLHCFSGDLAICPYLPPQAFRGQRNEPAHLLHTAQEVARLLNMPLDELGRLTTENARRLFRLVP